MTKKQFIELADAINMHNRVFGAFGERFGEKHLDTLADFCKSQNPAFDRERWMAYIADNSKPKRGK